MGKAEKKKRIRDIQRRKAQRRKRRTFWNTVLLIAAIVVLITIVKACGGDDKKEKSDTATEQTTETPMPVATTHPTSKPKNKSGSYKDFYINSVFVGNSFIDGMEIYELVDDTDYFAKVGLNVNDALTAAADPGAVPVIDELDSDKSYDRIFMMFGENELGWSNSQTFKEQYAKLVEKAKKYQPEAKIYLLSVTPVSHEVSEAAEDGTTNDNIVKYNKLIKELAEEEKVTYCDIYKAVADAYGELPADAASDGIHFTKDYYIKCLKFISDNYADDKPEK